MKLEALERILPNTRPDLKDLDIAGLSSDSRKIQQNYLFFAIRGTNADGTDFISDAVDRGAAAIVVRTGSTAEKFGVPILEVADPRHALALASARFFDGQPDTMVAVTGTSGKTSVAAFTRQIWARAGRKAASIGTTGVEAPDFVDYGSLTTPDPVELHRLLRKLKDSGVTHAAMEASSHGLEQRRLDGVRLAAAAFTNLGRDHMDYHATVEDYHRAKMRLFDTLLPKGGPAVIFADDAWSKRTIDVTRAAGAEILTVGRNGSFISLKRVEHERIRQRAEVEIGGEFHEFVLPLAGDFQIANALVAAGLAIATGVPADDAIGALEYLEGAPGRLDLVGKTGEGAPVYVDYAHKPDALRSVLQAVRPFTTGKVVVVFGCGGDRDRGKRPIMGAIATELADVVVVTDDNPRSEIPGEIRAAILKSAPGAVEIADRREAISHAVSLLGSGDTLIVAGKGHEPGQTIGTETLPFSDHDEVRRALEAQQA